MVHKLNHSRSSDPLTADLALLSSFAQASSLDEKNAGCFSACHDDDDDDDNDNNDDDNDKEEFVVSPPQPSLLPPPPPSSSSSSANVRVVGQTLWKMLLKNELPRRVGIGHLEEKMKKQHASSLVDWTVLQKRHDVLQSVPVATLQKYYEALSSILILDHDDNHSSSSSSSLSPVCCSCGSDPRIQTFLQQHNAKVMHPPLDKGFIKEILAQSPESFYSRVRDNVGNNLAYAMKRSRGFATAKEACNSSSSSSTTMTPDQWEQHVQDFRRALQQTLLHDNNGGHVDDNNDNNNNKEMEIQTSYLKTERETIPQPAHVDFAWPVLHGPALQKLWIGFFPLTAQGMFLQIWPNQHVTSFEALPDLDSVQYQGTLVYLAPRTLLLVPADTVHGGGFRTPRFNDDNSDDDDNDNTTDNPPAGNLRYHLYVATNGASLPVFAQNTYTMRCDNNKHMSQVCRNAPGLDDEEALLMKLLFS